MLQVVGESFEGGHQLLVFEVVKGPARGVFAERPKEGHQLAEAQVGAEAAHLGESVQNSGLDIIWDQSLTPIRLFLMTFGLAEESSYLLLMIA